MNIIYAFDNNYFRHALISVISLLQYNKNINFYFIVNNVDKENLKKLEKIVEGNNYQYIKSEELISNISIKVSSKYPLSAYARLFVQNFISADKALYLDCDTIINGSLETLYNEDIDQYYLGAVQDTPRFYHFKILNFDKTSRYVNSGVLLYNLKKWRNDDAQKRIVDFINNFKGKVPHEDQGVVNGVFSKKIKILDPQYNAMPQFLYFNSKKVKKMCKIENFYDDEQLMECKKNPIIIHYLGLFYGRPWHSNCTHPFKKKYVEISEKQGYEIIEKKQDKKMLFQKYIYFHFPFWFFCLLQNLLDIRRKKMLQVEVEKK